MQPSFAWNLSDFTENDPQSDISKYNYFSILVKMPVAAARSARTSLPAKSYNYRLMLVQKSYIGALLSTTNNMFTRCPTESLTAANQ